MCLMHRKRAAQRTCKNILPGPVSVVAKYPSPPQQHIPIRPVGVMPNRTLSSMATTEREFTVIVSFARRFRYTTVPPAAKKATEPFVPASFCRQQPKPAQQQVAQPQSRSHETSTSPICDMYTPGWAINLWFS
jgi:hypothetical protein